MEDREFFNETQYIEGFNLGYRMTREFPELAEILDLAKGNSNKLDGMKDGKQQYLEEILGKDVEYDKSTSSEIKSDTPNWLKDNRIQDLEKENLKNKGKDIEPET